MAILPITKTYPERLTIDEIRIDSSPALFDNINDAVEACVHAQALWKEEPLSKKQTVIKAIRDQALRFAEDFALCAISETGRGRYEDKVEKQKLAATKTPGTSDLKPRAHTGDCGLTIIDYAPLGVIGSVTPVTNPTATVINNTITILSGGNGVVYNPHPSAATTTNRAVAVLHDALVAAGAPPSIIASVKMPTIETGHTLMHHPLTAANLITGGPAVVKVAMQSGKKSFCAGPGNPPVVVDETAEMTKAANGIYNGASFDNNMICSDEKEVFVVDSVADGLIEELKKKGAYLMSPEEIEKVTELAVPKNRAPYAHGIVDSTLVGQNASAILGKAGISIPDTCRLAIGVVPEDHPLVWTEQLMPIMPIVRVSNFAKALELAVEAEYHLRHTASIYSSNLEHITEMAHKIDTSIFVVNGSTFSGLGSGGEGYTSFSIAGTTGEGLTRPSSFVRERRMVCVNSLAFTGGAGTSCF